MDSQFDAQMFLNAQTSEEGSTKITPFPAGDYLATVEKVEARSGIIGKGDRAGEPWISLDVTFKLQEYPGHNLEELAENLGRQDRMVRQSYFIDTTPEGGLDMGQGKNLGLNRLRDALGQNVAGQPWSPVAMQGCGPLVVRLIEKPDDDDPDTIYNRVQRTAPLQAAA